MKINWKLFVIIAIVLFLLFYIIASKFCWPVWGICKPGEGPCPPQSVVDGHSECLTSAMAYGFIPILIISYLVIWIYKKVRK